jgi:hypothetical protein
MIGWSVVSSLMGCWSVGSSFVTTPYFLINLLESCLVHSDSLTPDILEDLGERRNLTYPSEWSGILEALDHFLGRLISRQELLKQRGFDEVVLSDLMQEARNTRKEVKKWLEADIPFENHHTGKPCEPLRTLNHLSTNACNLDVLLHKIQERGRGQG